MANPSELQGTIVWMAGDASSYLNGSNVVSVLTFLAIDRSRSADCGWWIHLLVKRSVRVKVDGETVA
jgi:hypothetical protein